MDGKKKSNAAFLSKVRMGTSTCHAPGVGDLPEDFLPSFLPILNTKNSCERTWLSPRRDTRFSLYQPLISLPPNSGRSPQLPISSGLKQSHRDRSKWCVLRTNLNAVSRKVF